MYVIPNKYHLISKLGECVLNRELLSNINVFGNKSRNAVFLSPNLWFDPGRELFFNCKNQTYEPVNRKFQCRKGQWIAADEDPNWTMIIDSVNSSCRPGVVIVALTRNYLLV